MHCYLWTRNIKHGSWKADIIFLEILLSIIFIVLKQHLNQQRVEVSVRQTDGQMANITQVQTTRIQQLFCFVSLR